MHAVKPLPFAASKLRGLSTHMRSTTGAAAAKYVDAFFQNIQWDEVNRRLESAQRRST
ncbi:MAG TPA: hypothetical protein VI356_21555 [Myxococcales bacterium]